MPSAIPLFLRPPVYKITVLYCFPFAFSIPPLSHVFKAISSIARLHLLPVKAAASQARSRISSGTILHTDLASVKKQLLKTGLLIPFRKSEYLWKKTEQTGIEKIPVRSYEDFCESHMKKFFSAFRRWELNPRNTQKLAVTASRRKDVYNRTGEPSVTFCERGNAEKRADVFLARKTEQSELCSDMVETEGTNSYDYLSNLYNVYR